MKSCSGFLGGNLLRRAARIPPPFCWETDSGSSGTYNLSGGKQALRHRQRHCSHIPEIYSQTRRHRQHGGQNHRQAAMPGHHRQKDNAFPQQAGASTLSSLVRSATDGIPGHHQQHEWSNQFRAHLRSDPHARGSRASHHRRRRPTKTAAKIWTGPGITSSTAAASKTAHKVFAIGYLDGNLPPRQQPPTTRSPKNQLILKYTLTGDAFLENTVGFDDLLDSGPKLRLHRKDWAQGSFDTGSVGFSTTSSASLKTVAPPPGVSEGSLNGAGIISLAWRASANVVNGSAAVVPEPNSFLLVSAFAGLLAPRRRRSRDCSLKLLAFLS